MYFILQWQDIACLHAGNAVAVMHEDTDTCVCVSLFCCIAFNVLIVQVFNMAAGITR